MQIVFGGLCVLLDSMSENLHTSFIRLTDMSAIENDLLCINVTSSISVMKGAVHL
jgi:hypothetical protein